MDVYKIPIEYAFIVFPFIAFILTIPFLIHQYRKFGSIPMLKSFCFYSMILYLICAYFLVMLPLPSFEKVAAMTGPTYQLVPFQFIKDIMATVSFEIKNITDLIEILKHSTMYTIIFNIVLTLPFGIYLRYIFKKKWYHTIIYTFLLSLFFELTQLSGLYGIYSRPYRLFDVDDLMINTLGGLIGHIITPLVTIFIPSIDKLDEKSYKKGTRVTLISRGVSLVIDILFIIVFTILAKILFYGTGLSDYSLLFILTLYYVLIPPFVSGKTLGKKVIRLKLSSKEEKTKWYQILIRNIILAFFILFPYSWINLLPIDTFVKLIIWIVIITFQIINVIYYIYTVIGNKQHAFLYEKITNTKNLSTIEYERNEQSNEKNEEKNVVNNCNNK